MKYIIIDFKQEYSRKRERERERERERQRDRAQIIKTK